VTSVHCVGVLAHPTRPQTAPIAEQIAASLEARGIETRLYTVWQPADVVGTLPECDVVEAIGGDGAMLRSARVCAPFGIPVLGINMGHLGFLTEVPGPDLWDAAMDDLLAERYWTEQRMMVDVDVWRSGVCIRQGEALNEAVIGRGNTSRIIQLDTYIDGEWTTTYNADALIVATATGSTAYALAAGGPILPPEMRSILLVPVAPHLSLDRPMVLPEGATVEVFVARGSQADATISVDGDQLAALQPGDHISVRASRHVSRFIRMREKRYFYRSLLDRLEPRMPVPPTPERRQLDR
jgi:NAD+ kinase